MAAALTRKVPGLLLRTLVVCAGAPKLSLFSPAVTRPPPPTLQKPCTPVWAAVSARSAVLKLCNFKEPQFSPIRATDHRDSHLVPFAHARSYGPLRRFHLVPDHQWNPRGSLMPVLSRRVSSPLAIPGPFRQPIRRSLTYYSVKKAKRKSVESVKDRFLRLHCGLWVRRQAGYKKKLWRKPPAKRSRLRQHVFCNKTQSKLLDKMTTAFWKRRNWYLDDPYVKYHDRVNLQL